MRHYTRGLFLIAYACSGMAALIYQVAWTRLLTLYMGHTTAAASTVVAAFMGGLALGAAGGGTLAAGLTARRALYVYAALEAIVIGAALAIPWELASLVPLLSWAYQDGASGLLFPGIRVSVCLLLIVVPAVALGASFPLAARWFAERSVHPGREGGQLYAANTLGAAIGALLAGFVAIPALGISGTTLIGIGASTAALALALLLARRHPHELPISRIAVPGKARKNAANLSRSGQPPHARTWVAAAVLGLTGFATFMFEIAWMRVLSLLLGPTAYAFAATIAAVIIGLALGSGVGSWLAGRVRHPATWLVVTLATTAVATSWTTSMVGHDLPRFIAEELARSPFVANQLLTRHALLVIALILPTAIGLGIGFPLALELLAVRGALVARLGIVYGVNTAGAVAGSLVAGFVAIPRLGLQHTLDVVGVALLVAALVVLVGTSAPARAWILGLVPMSLAVVFILSGRPWDRDLLASGVYLYATRVPPSVDLETSLKAGTLLYYRDGAASTVSVKQLTGEVSLSIDGKVDASSGSDMPTQKTLAHLPLLLHPNPQDVLVIGLGSGVTAASALVHPISTLDIVELSPEVVEASRYFDTRNGSALDDPRTRLVVGDGRSHLWLSTRKYDVIISEPSNPWMAGVTALFTREFFSAARARLAPGGIICQWAHTYTISAADLRSIVATFLAEFPQGTMWMIGRSDLLLIASTEPLNGRLDHLSQAWSRPGVAADLREISASGLFAFLSSFAAGPEELRRYAGNAPIQTDDRMALEFSGPRALYSRADRDNASAILELLGPDGGPPAVRNALQTASAADWRDRGTMMLKGEDFNAAYEDYLKALALDPADDAALAGLIQAAVATGHEAEATQSLRSAWARWPDASAIRLALSRILAGTGAYSEAISVVSGPRDDTEAAMLEQRASIFADIGDEARLAETSRRLESIQPNSALTKHYLAAAEFLAGRFDRAAAIARQATTLDPAYAPAQNLLGACYANLGRLAEARKAFDAALQANPRDDTTYVNLGFLELQSRRNADAARYFAEALSISPRSEAAHQGLSQARAR